MRPVIAVFAKAPVPGRVKTRLIGALTAPQAALLHEAFVRDTIAALEPLAGFADLELHTDIQTDAWPGLPVPRKLQHEGDLGLKMFKALDQALENGCPRACIVGTDVPTLPAGHVRELLGLDADVTLGPTEDGGYYAVTARRVHPDMFRNVRWSTHTALGDTVLACAACGLTTALGPVWFDVDDGSGLEKLRSSKGLPPHTAAVLSQLTTTAR